MRRIVIFSLFFCFYIPVNIEAKKKPFGNGLFWEVNNFTLTISGNGLMPNYEKCTKYPWHGKRYERIIIEYGVASIADNAFRETDSFLKSVEIPESVTSIGTHAFCYCINLSSIELPNSINYIGAGAFLNCYNLKSISIPDGVKSIEMDTFNGCYSLSSVLIPNSVKNIGYEAFCRCNLSSILIPKSVVSIEDKAFGSDSPGFGLFKGEILNLPSFIVESNNPTKWGLSEESFNAYKNGVHDRNGKLLLAAKRGRTISKHTIGSQTYFYVEEIGKNGILDINGQWCIPQGKYEELKPIGNDFIKIRSGKNYGIVSFGGKEIIPTSRGYTSISDYDSTKGTFAFTKKGFSGVCNAQGREISTTRLAPTLDEIKENGGYASAVEMMNGSTKYYKVSKGEFYGLTDSEGKEIVPCEMEALESAGTGYLKYKINGFWGLMDYAGKILIDTDRGYTSIGDFKTFNKRFPYTMAGYKGECDINGRQLSKIKVEAPQQNVASSSSSSTSSSTSRTGTTQTVVVEHHRDPIPMQEWQACFGCGGMGTMGCHSCGGSGTKYIGDRLHRCGLCNGRGIIPCNVCYGNKGKYITVYK